MKKLFLPIIAFALIFSFSKVSYSQATDASESDANTTETKTVITGEVCPVSGETIGEGEGVVYNYLGTDYKFCCKNCVKKFKAEPMDYIKGELKCPVMGETASKDDFTVVDNVKYYFCCAGCKGKFEKDPEKYLNKEKKDN
jgi:YHS domain-containing protein